MSDYGRIMRELWAERRQRLEWRFPWRTAAVFLAVCLAYLLVVMAVEEAIAG